LYAPSHRVICTYKYLSVITSDAYESGVALLKATLTLILLRSGFYAVYRMHIYTSVSGVFRSPSHILLSEFTYYEVAPNTKLPSSYYSPFITRVILLYKNIVNSLTLTQ